MRRCAAFGMMVAFVVLLITAVGFCEDVSGGGPEALPPPMYSNDLDQVVPEYAETPAFGEKQFSLPQTKGARKIKNRDNGIVVGQPKLFELRSLQMMIDSVKASLAQTAYPDPSQLYGMVGRFQGMQSTSTSTSVETSAVVGSDTKGGSQLSASHGGSSGSDFESRSTISLSPTDVLAEQTSLWHQLVNLQMLLDGALSDRLIPVDETGSATPASIAARYSPRAQAVVGFQISVDPRRDYRNAVAEAIITIDNKAPSLFSMGGYGDEPSLMMLLPRSQTYNTISINRDSRSFGLGSVVNVVSFGLSQDKRRETYYIGKDTDTVALEKIPGLPAYGLEKSTSAVQSASYRGVSFGWQFRPVFNRASVDPGVRQVFAMVSLPASVMEEKWTGKVRVITYWRHFDSRTGTVGRPIKDSLNEWVLDDITVPIGSGVEEALKPLIAGARWEDVGGGNVAVSIEGNNFSLGTDVACGDTLVAQKNLALMSAKRIRFTAPASAIARGDVTLIGRYGVASLKQSTAGSDDPYAGMEVSAPRYSQQDDQTTAVELVLSKVANPGRLVSDRRPVVQLDSQLFGVGDKPLSSISANDEQKTVTLRFSVPTHVLTGARDLVVRDLVGPAAIPVEWGTQDGSCIAHKAVVLSTGGMVSVAVLGRGFKDGVRVQVGGREVPGVKLDSSDGKATMITFDVDAQTAQGARYILVSQGSQPPMLVPFSTPQ